LQVSPLQAGEKAENRRAFIEKTENYFRSGGLVDNFNRQKGLRQEVPEKRVDTRGARVQTARAVAMAFSKNYLVHGWHQAVTCVCVKLASAMQSI
jgi:hypothetical protein